ncbi:MAG TPA: HAD family phosphatase [Bacillota bacterium]|nr:HAD family phosphatase [Bacillota bacterium]
MIAGAIFDLDGTVLDSMKVWEDAPELYLESLGIKAEPGLGKTLFPMSMAEGAEFLKEHYCPDKDADAIIKGVNRIVRDFYFEQVRLKEGVGQFLKDLKQAGIKITAATTSDREFVEKALERLDILDCFDRIFTCTEIGAGKSQPDIFLAAAEYMETVPGSTWVFEDSLYAIKTAKKAGFRTVGVYDESAGEDQEEIRSLADIYLERLGDVAAFSGDVAAFSAKLKCCHSAEQEEI